MMNLSIFGAGDLEDKLDAAQAAFELGMTRAALHLKGEIGATARVMTGALRASWQESAPVVQGSRVIIGTNVEYAPYVGAMGEATGYRFGGVDHAESKMRQEKTQMEIIIAETIMREMRDA